MKITLKRRTQNQTPFVDPDPRGGSLISGHFGDRQCALISKQTRSALRTKFESVVRFRISDRSDIRVNDKSPRAFRVNFSTPLLSMWKPRQDRGVGVGMVVGDGDAPPERILLTRRVTRTSLPDRFRARGEKVSWRRLRSGLCLIRAPAPPLSLPTPPFLSPTTVPRGRRRAVSCDAQATNRVRVSGRFVIRRGVGTEFQPRWRHRGRGRRGGPARKVPWPRDPGERPSVNQTRGSEMDPRCSRMLVIQPGQRARRRAGCCLSRHVMKTYFLFEFAFRSCSMFL